MAAVVGKGRRAAAADGDAGGSDRSAQGDGSSGPIAEHDPNPLDHDRAFFNWLVREAVLVSSPAEGVTLAVDAAEDRVRDVVVPDFRFIDLLASRLRDPDDRLIFELLLGTGGRRSEVAGMRVGDVDLAANRVGARAGHRSGGAAGVEPRRRRVGGTGPWWWGPSWRPRRDFRSDDMGPYGRCR